MQKQIYEEMQRQMTQGPPVTYKPFFGDLKIENSELSRFKRACEMVFGKKK
jgi:hypothetical protein